MKRNGLIFITSLVLTLCAGIVLGAVWAKLPVVVANPPTPAPTTKPGPGWVESQLHLRPEQKAKMDAIWSEVHQKMFKSFETRRSLEKERDDTCRALLSDEQRAQWDKIRDDYKVKISAASSSNGRETLFREADTKTREILDPDQQKIWDKMKEQRDSHRGQGGPRGMNRPGSTTRPWNGQQAGPGGANRDHDGPPPAPPSGGSRPQ